MAREHRIIEPNRLYHIMNRGAGKQIIFNQDVDYRYFLFLISCSARKFNLRILAFCLMPNHYHLLVCPKKEALSQAMKMISQKYTQTFNKHNSMDGPLFRGRYKSKPITDQIHANHLIRYIHDNPVKAGLVPHAQNYKWSSYSDLHLKMRRFDWLDYKELAEFNLSLTPLEENGDLYTAGV